MVESKLTRTIFCQEEGTWTLEEFIAMLRDRAGEEAKFAFVNGEEEYGTGYFFIIEVRRPETPE